MLWTHVFGAKVSPPIRMAEMPFSSDAELKAVTKLLDDAFGVVVIALERSFFPAGVERRGGPDEASLENIRLPTPFNQTEAAMAYAKNLPLLVIVETGLKPEGLLKRGYEWHVQSVEPTPAALSTPDFNGVFADWKSQVTARAKSPSPDRAAAAPKPLHEQTIREIVASLGPAHLWKMLAAVATLVTGAFALGVKFH